MSDGMETLTLVSLAEAYGKHCNLKLSSVSTYATGGGTFFRNLKAGTAGCTLKTAATVLQWFADNWPDDLEWPRDIARPAKTKKAA
jgi:hypothetical protein